MIRGVNNNPYHNPYDSGKRVSGKSEEKAPAFLLNYDESGVVWERNKKEAKKKEPVQESTSQGGGVVYESSFDAEKTIKTAEIKKEESGFDFSAVFRKIGDFFRKIADFFWYGDEDKTAGDNSEELVEETAFVSDGKEDMPDSEIRQETTAEEKNTAGKLLTAEEKDEKIRELLRKKDTEGVMDVLTEHHKLRLARNSTLLTYYDKRGRIVSVTGADKERILYGDGIEKSFREKI